MSTSKPNLTQDEQTLHHHAAMLRKNLEAYHACTPRDEAAWRKEFKSRLVFRSLAIHFVKIRLFVSERSNELFP